MQIIGQLSLPKVRKSFYTEPILASILGVVTYYWGHLSYFQREKVTEADKI